MRRLSSREEPYALKCACTDLCGGRGAILVPTATRGGQKEETGKSAIEKHKPNLTMRKSREGQEKAIFNHKGHEGKARKIQAINLLFDFQLMPHEYTLTNTRTSRKGPNTK